MPVLGFEASHVSSFLKLIHPGLFMELSTEIIMETAPVAHYFQVFAVLERFVLWLTRFNEVDEPPDDAIDAILLVERLRVRMPGRCPWAQRAPSTQPHCFHSVGECRRRAV